ncbi:MAG: hypothetical protein H0T91_11060 [Propionibacteriaceae bacterium]|nr:hypothetical protein [Propionibacteriaceae bacterium]
MVRRVDADNQAIRTREGGWVRGYLARPWFVTGETERLGSVVGDTALLKNSSPRAAALEGDS